MVKRTEALALLVACTLAACSRADEGSGDLQSGEARSREEAVVTAHDAKREASAAPLDDSDWSAYGDTAVDPRERTVGADDEGQTVLVSGRVTEVTKSVEGFFLQTPAGKVIFVASNASLAVGTPVDVTGVVASASPGYVPSLRDRASTQDDPNGPLEQSFYLRATTALPSGP